MVKKISREQLKEAVKSEMAKVLSTCDIFAGLIWHFCINSRDHLYRGEYYDLPVSFFYDTDGVSILYVSYLEQQNSWSLLSPDYKHIRRISPLVLKWLDETYNAYQQRQAAIQATKQRRPRRRRPRPRPIRRPRVNQQTGILTNSLGNSFDNHNEPGRPSGTDFAENRLKYDNSADRAIDR